MKLSNVAGWVTTVAIAVMLALQSACTPPPPEVKQLNQSPVIENISYARDAFANSEVQIDCIAKDADSDNLTYKWTAEAGEIRGKGNSVLWMPPGKMGTYPITLAVTDGNGGVATENISIRVVTNADGTATPEVDINLKLGAAEPVVMDKQRIRIWMTTDISCTVEETGGGDLTYTWSATEGKLQGNGLEAGKANKIKWIAPGVKSDATVSVTVKNGQGKEARGQINFNVFCCGN